MNRRADNFATLYIARAKVIACLLPLMRVKVFLEILPPSRLLIG